MHGSTHVRFTKKIAPWIDEKTIQKVNKALDQPTKNSLAISSFYRDKKGRTPFDMTGLVKYGHRKNHDILTATILGLAAGGAKGAVAANVHLIGDMLRDNTNKRIGARGSDVIEAIWNYYDR